METKPKSRLATLMMATLAGTLALGGVAATSARAETNGNDAATIQALGAAKISLADAIRAAEAAGQGVVTGAEFGIKDGKPAFDVTTQNGQAETDHLIDPATGAVIASTPSTEKDGQDGETTETSEVAALQSAKVSVLQAITAAEGQGGKVVSAEYGHEDGALSIQIEVADAAGKMTELTVDAATGKVMAADKDSSDGENGEGGEGGEGNEEQEG